MAKLLREYISASLGLPGSLDTLAVVFTRTAGTPVPPPAFRIQRDKRRRPGHDIWWRVGRPSEGRRRVVNHELSCCFNDIDLVAIAICVIP